MKSSFKPMSIYDFGAQLIETRDIDPVYVVLWEAKMPRRELCHWLLAYWCFYHCGTASWITDGHYWDRFMQAAQSKEYPRSSERRHFRGQQAVNATFELSEACRKTHMTPQSVIGQIAWGPTFSMPNNVIPQLHQVMERVKTLRGFGEWIAFKVADMLERLEIAPVAFKPTDVFNMFDAPRKGAEAMVERHGPAVGDPYLWAYKELRLKLNQYKAPPRYERGLNIQECETIFCKYKSHLNGHYEIGKDIKEVHHGLQRFDTPTAKKLLQAGQKAKLW